MTWQLNQTPFTQIVKDVFLPENRSLLCLCRPNYKENLNLLYFEKLIFRTYQIPKFRIQTPQNKYLVHEYSRNIIADQILCPFYLNVLQLNQAEASNQDLLRNKARLEHDLGIKSNSLHIDREGCLSSRKSFPVVSLSTKL